MDKSRIFLILSLSFIIGIFANSFFDIDLILIYCFSAFALAILVLGYRNKKALIASGAILFFIFGVWRTRTDLNKIKKLDLEGKNISANAVIIKEPEKNEKYQKLVAEISGLKILINANLHFPAEYGDELKVVCALQKPENFSEDFNYQMYLAKDKIYYVCKNAEIEKTGENKASKFYGALLKARSKMEGNISRIIPQPQAALANGILFGGSSRLSRETSDNFSKTGMTHIVAVSGYNVTIIAEYLIALGIFLGFWRNQAFWFAVIGIALFILMIGFPSSAVRAGVMGTLLLWAMKNGRLAHSVNAVVFAGFIMLLINPLLLRWDIGFQLSFLATLGIVFLAPFWEKHLVKKHKAFGITETIFLTISAQVFVLPIILYNFHIFSTVSILANALILPIVPLSMFLVFLTVAAGLIWNPLALALAWLAHLVLYYEITVVNLLAGPEWASLEIKNFPGWLLAGWYLFLIILIALSKKALKLKSKI